MDRSSVTLWLDQLREGDSIAAAALWDRYFGRLVGLAQKRLNSTPMRAFDGEDVVVDVFDSVCRGVRAGRYPRLDSRDNLWRLLFVMTLHKAAERRRAELRLRRGSGKVKSEAAIAEVSDARQFDDLPDDEPTPEMAHLMIEETHLLLDKLQDPELRQIATLKMEGYTDEEIAGRLGCVRRTIVRRLKLIRLKWSESLSEKGDRHPTTYGDTGLDAQHPGASPPFRIGSEGPK